MKEKDLWKLEILRSHVIRYTKTWNQPSNRLNEQNKLYTYQHNTGTELFNIVPRNIFFDIKFITQNNILHTSQSYGIPQALQIMQRKTVSDENGTVQLQHGKTKLLDLINVNGPLLFQLHLLTTITSNLNNTYVEYGSKLGLNGKTLSEENLENYMFTTRYIVGNSYERE